jgi:nicotinamidase-related amidase
MSQDLKVISQDLKEYSGIDKIVVLIIDPQNDFCEKDEFRNEKGSLAVPGTENDMKNIVKMLDTYRQKIHKIIVSLDTHTKNHIGHELLVNVETGSSADGFTQFFCKNDKIISENPDCEYRVNVVNPEHQTIMNNYVKKYLKVLAQNSQLPAIRWPTHCIPKTTGWGIHPLLLSKLSDLNDIQIEYRIKGQNQLAEMYSIMQAEVPYEDILETFTQDEQSIIQKYIYPAEYLQKNPAEYLQKNETSTIMKTYNDYNELNMKKVGNGNDLTLYNLNTKFNEELFNELTKDGYPIVVCGEALSHCVKFSIVHIAKKIKDKKLKNKVYILSNASSPVGSFENSANEFVKEMNTSSYGNTGVIEVEPTGQFKVINKNGGRRRNPFKPLLRKVTKRRKHVNHSTNKKRVKKQIRTRKGKKAQKTRSRK